MRAAETILPNFSERHVQLNSGICSSLMLQTNFVFDTHLGAKPDSRTDAKFGT